MQLQHTKATFTAIWVVSVILVALVANLTSAFGWAVLVVFATIPPMVFWYLWNVPAPSMSESIQRAKD